MEIVERIDHFLDAVYRIEENGHCIGFFYSKKDAEIAKIALEEAHRKKSQEW